MNRKKKIVGGIAGRRQLEVLSLVVGGKTNSEILKKLGIKIGAVRDHVCDLSDPIEDLKLIDYLDRCRNGVARSISILLALVAAEHGLISPISPEFVYVHGFLPSDYPLSSSVLEKMTEN